MVIFHASVSLPGVYGVFLFESSHVWEDLSNEIVFLLTEDIPSSSFMRCFLCLKMVMFKGRTCWGEFLIES